MHEEETPQVEKEPEFEETQEFETASSGVRFGVLAVVLLAFVGLFGYSIHERNLARQLAGQNDQAFAALKETRSQMDALKNKLDSLVSARQPAVDQQATPVVKSHAIARHVMNVSRW